MAISEINQNTGTSTTTSVAMSLGSNFPVGTLVVVSIASVPSQASSSSCSDSKSNTYTLLGASLGNSSIGGCHVYYSILTTQLVAGTDTITAGGGSAGCSAQYSAYSGVATSGELDITVSQGSLTALSSGTPGVANELIVGIAFAGNPGGSALSGYSSPGAGWNTLFGPVVHITSGGNTGYYAQGQSFFINSGGSTSAQTYSPSWTNEGSGGIIIISFKPIGVTAFTLNGAIGTYSITGDAAAVLEGHKLLAAAGSYSMTGDPGGLQPSYPMACSPGSFAITGSPAEFLTVTFDLGVGSYTITGSAASKVQTHVLGSAVGSFSITGGAATLQAASSLPTTVSGLDGVSEAHSGSAQSSVSATLSTQGKNDLILAYVATISTVGYKAVSSVTGAGLTFAQRSSIDNLTFTAVSDGLVYFVNLELWWAEANTALTSETITAHTAAVTGVHSDISIVAFGVSGADFSNLWNISSITGNVAAGVIGGPSYSTTGSNPTFPVIGSVPSPSNSSALAVDVADTDGIGGLYAYYDINSGPVTNSLNLQSESVGEAAWEYLADVVNLVSPLEGVYVLTGAPAGWFWNHVIDTVIGTYTITGNSAIVDSGLGGLEAPGSFIITGADATFDFGSALDGAAGSFTINGSAANLLLDLIFDLGTGSFTITGSSDTFDLGFAVLGAAGSYIITGDDAALMLGLVLDTASGDFTINGSDGDLFFSLVLGAGEGSFTITGSSAMFVESFPFTAGSGIYVITGYPCPAYITVPEADFDEFMNCTPGGGGDPPGGGDDNPLEPEPPGRGGGGALNDPPMWGIERELFRGPAYRGGIDLGVPPGSIARAGLTTPFSSESRPAVQPIRKPGK